MFYIYCGKQKFFLKEQIKKKVNTFLHTINSLNYLIIDDSNIDNIIRCCLEIPLFEDKKVIIINDASFLLEKNKIAEKDIYNLNKFLMVKNDNIIVFFLILDDKVNFNKKISEDIFKNVEVFIFPSLNKNDWFKYVQTIVSEKKIDIQKNAVLELAERTLNDYDKLFNEIEKICLCERKILVEDIFDLVNKPIEQNVFNLLNNLIDGNVFLSLQIYYDLVVSNSFNQNFSIFLLSMFAGQIRFFYLCHFLFENGRNVVEIANRLKANKIRVKIVLKKIKKIKNILHILDDIYNIDLKIKSNQIDKKLALELFIVNFKNYLN